MDQQATLKLVCNPLILYNIQYSDMHSPKRLGNLQLHSNLQVRVILEYHLHIVMDNNLNHQMGVVRLAHNHNSILV